MRRELDRRAMDSFSRNQAAKMFSSIPRQSRGPASAVSMKGKWSNTRRPRTTVRRRQKSMPKRGHLLCALLAAQIWTNSAQA